MGNNLEYSFKRFQSTLQKMNLFCSFFLSRFIKEIYKFLMHYKITEFFALFS